MRKARRALYGLLPLVLVLVLAGGCGEDEGQPGGPGGDTTGSIFVTVLSAQGQAVSGANVSTSPATGQYRTNATGTVLLDELPLGTYVLTAMHPELGSGNAATTIVGPSVESLSVRLVAGAFLQPILTISSPTPGSSYSYVDSVVLRAAVSDDEDAPQDLALRWSSDRDGTLSTASASSGGIAEVRLPPLSLGAHTITLEATDSDGHVGEATRQFQVLSFPPLVDLRLPLSTGGFVPGETIDFEALVTDRESPPAEVTVEFRSHLDGLLFSGHPDADGLVRFSRDDLSRGFHQLTLAATDGDSNVATMGRAVRNDLPQRVVLQAPEKDAGGIQLAWDPVNQPQFEAYRVARATSPGGVFQLIDVLDDIGASGYLDTGVQFGQRYWYRVGVRTTEGLESASNVVDIEAGIAIDIGTQVEYMIADPGRPYLYALDRVNNSLLFVNTDSMRVDKTIFVGSSPVHLDMEPGGGELFIANYGSTQIAVVDLDTQEVARNLSVDTTAGTWDGNPWRLACMGVNELVFTSYDQWNNLKLVDRDTGNLLQVTGQFHSPGLIASPDDTGLYTGGVTRYNIVDAQLVQADSGTGSGGRVFAVSADGIHLVHGRKKYLASNLSSNLGEFPEIIYQLNPDASLALGRDHVYNGNTFATLGDMPVQTTVMAMSPDGQVVYLYDTASSRVYLFDLSAFGG